MRKNNILNWIKLSSFIFALSSLFASCSNELDETLQSAGNGNLQFVVSDFPAFGEGTKTRAIGTQDEGKTAWANEDKILVHLYSQKYGDQAVTLTFDAENNTWKSDGGTLSYLENETPTITAVYAPDCEIKSDKTIGLLEGKQYGEAEYILARTTISENSLDINFESGRTYSRLRIAGLANQTLTVTTTDFTPAGAAEVATAAYTLTTDNNGNAFLYGVFAEDATVSVKQGDITLKDYTFTAEKNPNGTEYNKSYALDATPVIDGTLGGKAEATEDDITALVEQLKEYVDNGITTIIVPGSKSAIITVGNITETAIGEAIYRLSGNGNYDENNPYNGKIDLVLPDVTEIVAMEFYAAFALNSITLPKVTTIGDMAFQGCDHLTKLTFGSVLTTIDEHDGLMFWVGEKVDGCDLFLNCGQMNSQYVPDLATNTWTILHTNEFKSITLTHTGECDECKSNQ
ncbi:MAG: leucine-rich repeat protein [Bacteroidales bacterium]|nr:leucine-rich repeat protein [Bacteroidales bacterium]